MIRIVQYGHAGITALYKTGARPASGAGARIRAAKLSLAQRHANWAKSAQALLSCADATGGHKQWKGVMILVQQQ